MRLAVQRVITRGTVQRVITRGMVQRVITRGMVQRVITRGTVQRVITRGAACPAAWAGLAIVGAVCAMAIVGLFVGSASVDAQSTALSARIAAWKSADGTVELCLDLRDAVVGETRQCPGRRHLTFARAPQERWLRTNGIRVAPEVSIWVRARRVGERLDLGLGVSIEGQSRGFRARSWSWDWPSIATDRWQRTGTIQLQLPVAPHPELWTSEAGIAPGAQRLQVGRRAPEFRLPRLGGDEDALVPLSAAMSVRGEITLIVFWSSWAPFSDQTLTTLQGLRTTRDDLQVITVNVYEDSDDTGLPFAQRHSPTLLHLVDESGSVAQHYRVDGLPELFLIDAQGVYRAVLRGAVPLSEIEATIAAVAAAQSGE